MIATMPPAGTSNVPSDQTRRPPRTTLTPSNSSAAGSALRSGGDTECLGECRELSDLPLRERVLPWWHRLGDIHYRNSCLLGRGTDLLGDRALGLGVVDQHISLPIR